MKFRFKTLAFQIWLSFLVLIFILAVWLYFFSKAQNQAERLSLSLFELTNVHSEFSENIINYQNFVFSGYKEKEFYLYDQQRDIDEYLFNLKKIGNRLLSMEERAKINHPETYEEFRMLLSRNSHLIKLTDSLRSLIKHRGFKDYGVEGRMRRAAHALEDSTIVNRSQILQLRRHEKDFLLRGEKIYETSFNDLVHQIEAEYPDNLKVRYLLENYYLHFNEYVETSNRLSSAHNMGLIGEIKDTHRGINQIFSQIKEENSNQVLRLNVERSNFTILQTVSVGLLAIFLSFFLARTLTYDFKVLNEDFKNFIKSDFLYNEQKEMVKPKFKLSSFEIRKLFANFQLLKVTLNKTILQLNKEVEKSAKAANYKSRFLANMSHEIRTPLNGILGMLQLITIEKLSKQQQQHIAVAENSANHLLNLVNMILEHSKLEVGKMKTDQRPVDLRMILVSLNGIFQYQAQEKNLQFCITCAENIPEKVIADSMRIQQVLLNLLSNAIKFTDHGSVSLKVTMDSETEEDLVLNFSVSDTGIGINQKDKEKLFEAFEQADISTTRKHGGTGLGLTITNQLVELMGGELLLESELHKGARFYFKLKLKKVLQVDEIARPIESFHKPPQNFVEYKVLVVEDNKINQLVIDKMLKKIGINSLIAEDGREAYDLYLQHDFDLILMDIHMPVMNGFEATKRIKENPKYLINNPPVVAITASAFDEDREEALSKGMDDFITKPILFDNLFELMTKYLPLLASK